MSFETSSFGFPHVFLLYWYELAQTPCHRWAAIEPSSDAKSSRQLASAGRNPTRDFRDSGTCFSLPLFGKFFVALVLVPVLAPLVRSPTFRSRPRTRTRTPSIHARPRSNIETSS